MAVLAILLLIAAVVLTTGIVIESTESTTLEVLGASVDTTNAQVFLAGLVTGLVFLGALWMLRVSLRRRVRKRKTMRESRDRLAREREQLAQERDELAQRLGDEGERPDATGGDKQPGRETPPNERGRHEAQT